MPAKQSRRIATTTALAEAMAALDRLAAASLATGDTGTALVVHNVATLLDAALIERWRCPSHGLAA